MSVYSVVDYGDTTVKIVENGREYLYKKVYCLTAVYGDYVYFYTHQLETNLVRQQYAILYTDCVAPVGVSASNLKTQIDAIIDSYATTAPGFDPALTLSYISTF